MPKQTFFNLSDTKRQVLIDSAKKEFSRVPLYEASIANIVKKADIARGSFYQYFEDKEDLYFYLLQKDAESRRQEFLYHIQQNDGDLFIALLKEFESMLHEIENENVKKFYHHVFLNMNYRTEKTFMSSHQDSELDHYMKTIHEHIDTERLNLINDADLGNIIKITTSIMIQNIIDKFAKNLPNEDVLNEYRHQLDLLKRGFEKKG